MERSHWLSSPEINLDDAVITLDSQGLVIALNAEADRLGLDGDPHGKPFEATFPIRDEYSGQAPTAHTRSVVLPSRGGELRAFDLLVIPHGRDRGWTIVLRPTVSSGDIENEAWANLSKESKEGTGLNDPTTGTIGLVSETFAALHGYTPREMLGMSLGEIFANDGNGLREMERRLAEGAVSWEAEHLRKDGELFPVLMSVTTIRDPLGQMRFRAMRIEDISERRAAERRAEAHRLQLERVIAAVPSNVYLINLIEGSVSFLSNEIATALGYPVEEGPPPHAPNHDPRFTLAAVHPDDQAGVLLHWSQAGEMLDGEVRTQEYRFRAADGRYRWFLSRDTVFERDRTGRVVTVLGTSTDITERKKAERIQEFRLAFADALRPLTDPHAIGRVAVELLSAHLGTDRVTYAEYDDEGQGTNLSERATTSDAPSVIGTHALIRFGREVAKSLRAGRTAVIRDVEGDPDLGEAARAAYREAGIGAHVTVPMLDHGRLAASLALHSTVPRAWTSEEITIVEEIAERTWAAIERLRAEETLRIASTRDAFRLRLSDTLRPLTDPAEIVREASRVLGEHLRALRVGYLVDRGQEQVAILPHYARVVPSVEGIHAYEDLGDEVMTEMLAGRPAVRTGVVGDLWREEGSKSGRHPIRTTIHVPLMQEGHLLAVLFAHLPAPRIASLDEMKLLRESAERTWAAVESARNVIALRESEARYRTLADLNPSGIVVALDGRIAYVNEAAAAIVGYPEPDLLLGHEVLTFVVPEARERAGTRERLSIEGTPNAETSYDLIHRDGTRIPVQITSGPTVWSGRAAVQIVVHRLTRLSFTSPPEGARPARIR